jgi:pyrroloquinoline quinone (PQQ) biosynthesis protein C
MCCLEGDIHWNGQVSAQALRFWHQLTSALGGSREEGVRSLTVHSYSSLAVPCWNRWTIDRMGGGTIKQM